MGEKILGQLESLARFWQLKFMEKKRTIEVIEKGRICFHPQDARKRILKAYKERLKFWGLF